MIVNLEKPRIFFSGSYVVLKVLMNDLIVCFGVVDCVDIMFLF